MSRSCPIAVAVCILWLVATLSAQAPPAAPAKLPAPAPADVERAAKEVRELFEDAFLPGAKPADKLEAAKGMLAAARLPGTDPASAYALMLKARDLAVEAASVAEVDAALAQIDKQFAVNLLLLRLESYLALSKRSMPPAARTEFVLLALAAVDAAYRKGEILAAAELVKALPDAARGADDKTLLPQIAERRKTGSLLFEQQRLAEPALAAVKAMTATPEQKTLAGKFLCFARGEWKTGLDLLKQGSDEALKKVAELDRAAPADSEAQLAVADLWWAYAESAPEWQRAATFNRAGQWYRLALPKLAGLPKLRAAKRLGMSPTDIASAPPPMPMPAPVKPTPAPMPAVPMPSPPMVASLPPPVRILTAPAPGVGIQAEKLRIWNQHDGNRNDRGAKTVHITLYLGPREIWRRSGIVMPWEPYQPANLSLELPKLSFDRIRIELPDWHESGAGLAEVEVLKEGKNLAPAAVVLASETQYTPLESGRDLDPLNILDGDREARSDLKGFWLLPERTAGWIELEWTSVAADDAAKQLSTVVEYPLRRHPTSAVEFNGHWYAFVPGTRRWDLARKRCQDLGGHLVVIHNALEDEFVLKLTRQTSYWIGGWKDMKQQWHWVDGSPFDYANWLRGEPNDVFGTENRLEIFNRRWNDIPNESMNGRGYVCEWPF